jgi:hypothetical protein
LNTKVAEGAESDRISDRSWIHGFLLKTGRSSLAGNQEARNWLRENFAGRRCDQETLRQCFLAQPDGHHAVALAKAGPSAVKKVFLCALCSFVAKKQIRLAASSKFCG